MADFMRRYRQELSSSLSNSSMIWSVNTTVPPGRAKALGPISRGTPAGSRRPRADRRQSAPELARNSSCLDSRSLDFEKPGPPSEVRGLLAGLAFPAHRHRKAA